MKLPTRIASSSLSCLSLVMSLPAWAAESQLEVSLPSIEGARVKRPYLAVWLEKADSHEFAGNIAVWYDTRKPNNAGATKWLPDLRTWWRASGSQVNFPIDGVSGATRPAGEHSINLAAAPVIAKLPAGKYEVVLEVAREHGGHELLRLPLQWPPRATTTAQATGKEEIGAVRLISKP